MMGFFLQLRILLWKNFTLKIRNLPVLLLECFIPLVLFAILLAIRAKQPAIPQATAYFKPYPLPSAGLLSVLQTLCPNSSPLDNTADSERLKLLLEAAEKVEEYSLFFDTRLVTELKGNLSVVETSTPIESVDTFLKTLEVYSSFSDKLLPSSLFKCSNGHKASFEQDTAADNHRALLTLWVGVHEAICGEPVSAALVKYTETGNLDYIAYGAYTGELGLTWPQAGVASVFLQALRGGAPKILYAPNGTAADSIIDKATELFSFVGGISTAANKWLAISDTLRSVLENSSARHYLKEYHKQKLFGRNSSDKRLKYESPASNYDEEVIQQLNKIDSAACMWSQLTASIDFNIFRGFATERELVNYVLTEAYADNVTVVASLVFVDMPEDGSLPSHVVYKIRQNASLTDSTLFVRERYWSPGPRTWNLPLYYQYGFVLIQDAIERAIIDLQVNRSVKHPGLYIHQMPSPCFMHDEFLFMIEHVMPLCVTASWVYVVSMLVQSIVYEKEQRLKEVMRMMGLRNTVHWLAWFFTTFVQMTVTVLTLTLMLKLGHVLEHSNTLIVFLVLELFAVTSIMFSFLVSVCYSKAKLAAACAGVIYFLTYVPYMYIAIREEAAGDRIPAWAKSLASLLPTASFGMGIKYFAFYEIQGMGMQWYNMALSPVEGDEFSLVQVIVMLFIDCIIYATLTWYIEHVHPGSYGLPQPWYFPLSKSYWRGHSARDDDWCCGSGPGSLSVMEEDQQAASAQRLTDQDYSHFEPEPTHAAMAVHIDNLTKVYKTGKVAVKNLSLRLYEDQILALLGHNGAGKTTTMSILSGLYPPTHGTASIYGMDIRTDMENIHKMLGICPQHNVLFDRLTVDEHLWFYCRMKGAAESEIKREIERMVTDLGLPSKRHCTVDSLSGGTQRKLSIAISFVSGSRLVILDEPTAGVDPYARRAIWDLLVKYKSGRTILLSTHHMDEADVLGDRIAIISNGALKCSGSALYLKKMFGEGYHLNIVKKPIDEDTSSNETMSTDGMSSQSSFVSRCSAARVTDFILKHVDTAYLKCDTGRELQYVLPFDEACKGHFSRLFTALDQHLASLEISSYGVMDTSLEEVFIAVNESQQASSQELSSAESSNNASVMQRTNKFFTRLLSKLLRRSNQSRVGEDATEPLLSASDKHDAENPTAGIISPCERAASPATTIGGSGDCRVDVDANFSPCASVPVVDVQTPTTVDKHLSVSATNTKDQLNWSSQEGGAVLPSETAEASYDLKHWLLTHGDRQQQQQFASSVRSPPASLINANVSGDIPVGVNSVGPQIRGPSINSIPQTQTVPSSRRSTRSHRSRSSLSNQEVRVWDEMEYVSGSLLYANQFWAILVKRFYYVWRNRKGLFSQIILPAVFVCVAMTVALSAPQVHDLPALVLSPAQYYNGTRVQGGSFVPYSIANGTEFARTRDADAQQLVQTFSRPCGLSATCVLRDARWNSSVDDFIKDIVERSHRDYSQIRQYFNEECESVFYNGKDATIREKPMYWHQEAKDSYADENDTELVTSRPWNPRYTPACYCDGNGQRCSTDGTVLPPTFEALTSEHMQNFSGDVDEDYYLYTTDMYRYQRYGGFQLGLTQGFVPETLSSSRSLNKLAAKHIAIVWYNDKGFHSVPVYVNTMNNAILRANLPIYKGNPSAFGITAINHPMTLTNSLLSIDVLTQGSDVLIAIFVIVAMSFVPASFVIFLVYENTIKAKHLQLVSGLNRVIYWLANYVWDMCNYFIPAICCIIILRSFNIPAYVSSTNFPAVILLFFLYGWSITPMMYPSTFLFNEPSSAYIVMIVANLFVGITCIITSFLLEVFQQHDEGLKQIHDVLKYIFLIFPNYCLGRGLIDVAFNEYQNEFYFTTGQHDKMRSPFDWYVTSRNLVAMSIVGVVFFIITLLCELKPCRLTRREQVPNLYDTSCAEDADVAAERRRVLRGSGRWDILRLTDLTKLYLNRKLGSHLAVDRLTLSVPEGECFGLLGVNGAGKTTTFRMLTGDLKPTSGDAFVNSYSIVTELAQMQKIIGYCPQFDALYEELTAKEHVELYARLRGIPASKVSEVASWVLKKLDLCQYTHKLSGTYSGGNKRKLSTAIALVGQPSVIFMDEPTTGMDPHSRRFLWDLVISLVQEGRSVVLTSHSMEECEALCTRLAIMVNGQVKCIGTPQHLKTCYGDGYTLSVRLASSAVEEQSALVQRFLRRRLPQAVLKESHHNLLQYQLASAGLSLAAVFTVMEEAQLDLHIEDYSVNQNTLDNVFIGFVKQQKELLQEMQVVAKGGASSDAAAAAAPGATGEQHDASVSYS